MRRAGVVVLAAAVGVVLLFEHLERGQQFRRATNAAAAAKYSAARGSYDRAKVARDAAQAQHDAAVATCFTAIRSALTSTKAPALAVASGPRARATFAKYALAPCDAAAGSERLVFTGTTAAVNTAVKRAAGKANRRETITDSVTRGHYGDDGSLTVLVVAPWSAIAAGEYVRPLLGAAPSSDLPTPPRAPTLASVSALRYRYVSLGAGFVLGLLGLVLLARGRAHGRPGRTRSESSSLFPAATVSVIHSPDAADAMIAQLRQDVTELQPFIRELFRVIVRNNPIWRRVETFHGRLEAIPDDASRSTVCQVVTSAIVEVDLANAVRELEEFNEILRAEVASLLSSSYDELTRALPDYRRHMPDLPDTAAAAAHSSRRMVEALASARPQLAVIEGHYRQLREFLPRYQSLMTRTGLLDVVLGFAAGYFVGGAAADIGARLWDGWREQSDQQFLESFSRAVSAFGEAAAAFTMNTEAAAEPVVQQAVGDYAEGQFSLIEGLRSLANRGYSIQNVYRALRAAPPRDPGTQHLFGPVLSNLRGQGLSGASERNLMALLGVR
jgi:hypothetical protein